MAQPYLDRGDIGVVYQGIGRGRCANFVRAQYLNQDARCVYPSGNDPVDPITRNRPAGGMAADRAK